LQRKNLEEQKEQLKKKYSELEKRARKRPVAVLRYTSKVAKIILEETITPRSRSGSLSRRATMLIQEEVECPPHLMSANDRHSFLNTAKEVNPSFFRSFYLKRRSYVDVMNSASSASSTDD